MTLNVRIEVVYSPAPRTVDLRELELPEGATVAEAIAISGLRERHAELLSALPPCGVWGRVCRVDRVLQDGDRVELYRPLPVDPKDARRQRGREQKQARRAGKLSGTGSA